MLRGDHHRARTLHGAVLERTTRGATVTNISRMWNYPEGIGHHTPVWSRHAVRIVAGPGSLWLDAHGRRLPPPLFPGVDTRRALQHLTTTGSPHSWLLLNRWIDASGNWDHT